MIYPKTKHEITALVFSELPDNSSNIWKESKVDDLVFKWWATGRAGSGFRLTEQGMNAFTIANLAYYDFTINVSKMTKVEWETLLRKLTKKLACPYYLGVNKDKENKGPFIRVYDHKIAMMVSLYGGLKDYIESVK